MKALESKTDFVRNARPFFSFRWTVKTARTVFGRYVNERYVRNVKWEKRSFDISVESSGK